MSNHEQTIAEVDAIVASYIGKDATEEMFEDLSIALVSNPDVLGEWIGRYNGEPSRIFVSIRFWDLTYYEHEDLHDIDGRISK